MHGMMPPLHSAAHHGVKLQRWRNQDVFRLLATRPLCREQREDGKLFWEMTVGVAKMFLAIHYLTSENGKLDELVTHGAF